MRITLTLSLLASLALSGCNGEKPDGNTNDNANSNTNATAFLKPPDPIKPTAPPDPDFKPCNPYYPLVPGSQVGYTLIISSGLVNDVTVVVDEAEEEGRKVFVERTRIVDKSGGLQKAELTVRKYACEDGRIQIFHENSENRIEGKLNKVENTFGTGAVFMTDAQSLGRKGSTWSYSFRQVFWHEELQTTVPQAPVTINFTVEGEEEVIVPAGKFKAIKILRRVGENEVSDYFARGIGLVKRVAAEGTTLVLTEYSGVNPSE
ncbi:MAG: hypothetical protein L0229_31700 [Blastocatellia bacterium]|nr:hypothetical protein [Blastocatellia bacterium]